MIIFVNSNNEIRDVGTTTDETLTALTIDDEDNPFADWSIAKICCYKCTVADGKVTMMTPYVDTRVLADVERVAETVSRGANECLDIIDGTTPIEEEEADDES